MHGWSNCDCMSFGRAAWRAFRKSEDDESWDSLERSNHDVTVYTLYSLFLTHHFIRTRRIRFRFRWRWYWATLGLCGLPIACRGARPCRCPGGCGCLRGIYQFLKLQMWRTRKKHVPSHSEILHCNKNDDTTYIVPLFRFFCSLLLSTLFRQQFSEFAFHGAPMPYTCPRKDGSNEEVSRRRQKCSKFGYPYDCCVIG